MLDGELAERDDGDLSVSTRILDVMQTLARVPAWVVPPSGQVADCHWIARARADRPDSVFAAVADTLDWVTSGDVTEAEAHEKMRACGQVDAAYNTVAWLIGFTAIPPIRLPRRNPDGTVVTADQLYDEYMAGKYGEPEQRIEARRKAEQDAHQYRQLAALVASY